MSLIDKCVPGKEWVKEQFQKEAQNKGIDDISLEWGPSEGEDFDKDEFSLKIVVGKERIIEKFSDKDLNNCIEDEDVQKKLKNRISEIIKSLQMIS